VDFDLQITYRIEPSLL